MGKYLLHTVGDRPNTVGIVKRPNRTNLYLRTWDSEKQDWNLRSLGHDNLEKAKAQAAKLHAKLLEGHEALRSGRVTFRRLLALYEKHRTPQKGEREQKADARRIELFTRFLGADKDPHRISCSAAALSALGPSSGISGSSWPS